MGPRQRQFFYADSLPWMAGKLYTWLCTGFELHARPFLPYTSHRFNLLHGEYGHNSEVMNLLHDENELLIGNSVA